MIELSNVTRKYGRGPEAVSGVTLTIPAGAVWGVAGPNGAGKSTLLSLILGFIRPTRGTVRIAGDRPRDYLRDFGASYLPERFSLPAAWRVEDALRLFDRLGGGGGAAAMLDRMGLAEHARSRTHELSRGLLQRVGLAQALLSPRHLMVLDEPTEGLDPVWRVRLRDLVRELRAAERTILVASHDIGELERMADRVIVLDRGRIKDILDVASDAPVLDYRISLAAPFNDIEGSFPGAIRQGPAAFAVRIADARELTQRLDALIASGALLVAVEPARQPLEDRVRAALNDREAQQ